MKTSSFMLASLIALAGFTSMPVETKAQRVSVNFSVFQSELSRYGRWVNSPRFGEVWVYDEPGFRPYYSKGYWDYSDYGWAWVSDYEWGWAPFHYGRWEQDPYYGWMWIPGYEWAPAWVSWSESSDYYGWAPLGSGLGINIKIGSIPYDRWVFCSRPYMNSRVFRDHCAPFNKNQIIVRNTTIINNYYNGHDGRYWKGPGRNDVERYTGHTIRSRQIDNDQRFGNKRWDDNNKDYADRDRNNNRDNNRFDPRDNNNQGNFPERRYDNRNDNNNSNNRNERREDNPTNNEIRRGRNERTREIRDDNNNRTNKEQNDNNQRQFPSGRQRERQEPNRVENRREDNNRTNRQQNDDIRRERPNVGQRSGEKEKDQVERRESNRNNGNNRQIERPDRGNSNGKGQGHDRGKRGRD